jgi:hypothetical protein
MPDSHAAPAAPANIFTPPSAPLTNPAPAVPVRVENAPPGTVQSSPDITPALLLWNEQQRRGDAAAGRLDQTRFVQVKDPLTGAITTRPRTAADGAVNPDQPAKPGDPAQPQQTTPDRIRVGDVELTADDLKGLMERRGLEESRRATMPEKPENYSLDLPADFKLPDGVQWQWNLADSVLTPLIGQAKEWAFANGIGQEGFSKMMSLFAASQVHEQQLISRVAAAEVEKLGAAANGRSRSQEGAPVVSDAMDRTTEPARRGLPLKESAAAPQQRLRRGAAPHDRWRMRQSARALPGEGL